MRAVRSTRITPPARLLAVAMAAAMTAVACSSPAMRQSSYGPVVSLRVGVYGRPGYQQSGLYREYEKIHPNIKIVPTATGSQASYWRALRAHLASGTGLDDIQAIPLDEISTVTAGPASDFVPLNTLGASALQGSWLPWAWQEATTA
jgi:cellobiose transport system substrate-binding protein